MPRYCLYLHDGPTTSPETQHIDVANDEDAEDMARITLLATQQFTHVEIWKDDALIATQKRDSYHPDV